MSEEQKSKIFQKYASSQPQNIQYPARNVSQLHPDFLLYVDRYTTRDPAEVSTQHLVNVNSTGKAFYQRAMSRLLHPVFGRFKDPMLGSANGQLYTFRRSGGSYSLELYGMMCGRKVITISDAAVEVGEDFVKLSSNNGYTVTLEETDEKFDTNQYAIGASSPNPVTVWKLTILKDDKLDARFHMVELKMK